MPLVCVHALGGNLFHYYHLVDYLAPAQPLYGLQAKGVYGHDTPDRTIEAIAADCVETMRTLQPEGPYHILGFSSAGIIGYEMAQQLKAHGDEVALLMMIDSKTPRHRISKPWPQRLQEHKSGQQPLHFREKLEFHINTKTRRDVFSPPTHIGAIQRWAYWSYEPQPYDGAIDLIVAEESLLYSTDPSLGWADYVGENMTITPMPGTHADLVKFPVVQLIGERLTTKLPQSMPQNAQERAAS